MRNEKVPHNTPSTFDGKKGVKFRRFVIKTLDVIAMFIKRVATQDVDWLSRQFLNS